MRSKNRQKRSVSFNPNHDYISDAVAKFIKKGGKIKRLEAEKAKLKDELNDSWIDIDDNSDADDFLND